MENIECLLFGPLCGMLLLLVLAAMVKHWLEYSANVRRVKTEIHRACDWKEYVYWKKELRNLRWSILPGLNPERVKYIRGFFYRGKHSRKKENDGLLTMLVPSFAGIVVCSVCLAAGTWAWFSGSLSTPTQQIQAASFDAAVAVTDAQNTFISIENGEYTLKQGTNTVNLTAQGTASTGYCVVTIDKKPYYTAQIEQGKSLVFTITVNDGTAAMSVMPFWGTYNDYENPDISVEKNSVTIFPASSLSDKARISKALAAPAPAPAETREPTASETTQPPTKAAESQPEEPAQSPEPVEEPPASSTTSSQASSSTASSGPAESTASTMQSDPSAQTQSTETQPASSLPVSTASAQNHSSQT